MLRPALVLALVLAGVMASAPVRAAGTSRVMGMYPAGSASTTSAPLPMLDSKVEVAVRGPIVETVVTQRFHNRSDRATEATYIFPLPPDAVVSAMWIQTGTRTIHAAIEKRGEAQRRYEAAVRAGVAAAVLDQERPDVFTQTVSAIPPKSTVAIVLRYDTVARHSDGTWTLALPMVVAPRYVPGTASGRPTTGTGRSPDTDRAPDASRITPPARPQGGGATSVAIAFAEPVTDVTSPTHELAGRGQAFTFTDPHSDHDAVVRWRAAAGMAGWVEASSDGGYAAVVVTAPPAGLRKGAARVVVVLDHAATMRGDAMIVVQPLARALFGALGAADRIAVVGSHRVPWSAPADALRVLEQKWSFAAAPFDLTRVLGAARPSGAPLVLITDGLVADDHAAIAAARKLGVPIHVIGVGAAPARGLLTQLAAQTGGTLRYAIPGDDLAACATATIADVATPPAPLAVTWGTLAARDVVPAVLPRLGAGQAMLVLARVARPQAANARARGELFAIETTPAPRVRRGATTAAGPLARRWARLRLDDLLVGAPRPAVVTAHALKFGLVSPYTSLVAIGTEVVVEGGVKHSVPVPVSVPAGMSWSEVKRETAVEAPPATGDAISSTTTDRKTGKTDKTDKTIVKKQRPARPAGGTTPGTAHQPTTTTVKQANKPRTEPVARPTAQPPPSPPPDVAAEAVPEDEDEDTGADGDAGDAPRARAFDVALGGALVPAMDEGDDDVTLSIEERRSYRRALRISTSLGGGVAVQDGTARALVALGARVEVGRRNLAGLDASLWLVDGLHGQGRVLATFARRGVARWLELGVGLGLHVTGDGAGPAAALSLRLRLPPAPRAATYLRYDAALLVTGADTRARQGALTLGLEWGF